MLYTTAADTLSSEAAFTYNASTNILSLDSIIGIASSTIGGGTPGTGLTIFGGATTTQSATTTKNHYIGQDLQVASLTSALLTTNADGLVLEYGGSSNPCTSQLPTTISVLGALGGCVSINNAFWSGAQLTVGNGGTGATTFGQGWIHSSGGTTALTSSTSPTVNYVVATSTTIASVFPYASTTAISSSNLTSGNCVQAGTGGLLTTAAAPCGSGGGGGLGGGFTQLATSTSMIIDICDSTNATSSILALGVSSSNIAVTMSGSNCLGKDMYVDVWAPLTGVIGTTTFSGVYWNGQINPGSNVVNGLTDRFRFAITASSTTFISAKLDSTY